MSTKTQKVLRISAIVVVVLLLVAVIAFISTQVIRESQKANFYLVHNGIKIEDKTTENVLLERGTPERFDITYFEGLEEEKQGYSVSVESISNGNNFYFNLSGNPSSFYAMRSDVTEFFDIEKQEDYFTITLDESFKATDVVEKVYSSKSVIFPEEVDCSKSYYKIVVKLDNGATAYEIGFRCEYEAEDINIGNSEVVIGEGSIFSD